MFNYFAVTIKKVSNNFINTLQYLISESKLITYDMQLEVNNFILKFIFLVNNLNIITIYISKKL